MWQVNREKPARSKQSLSNSPQRRTCGRLRSLGIQAICKECRLWRQSSFAYDAATVWSIVWQSPPKKVSSESTVCSQEGKSGRRNKNVASQWNLPWNTFGLMRVWHEKNGGDSMGVCQQTRPYLETLVSRGTPNWAILLHYSEAFNTIHRNCLCLWSCAALWMPCDGWETLW